MKFRKILSAVMAGITAAAMAGSWSVLSSAESNAKIEIIDVYFSSDQNRVVSEWNADIPVYQSGDEKDVKLGHKIFDYYPEYIVNSLDGLYLLTVAKSGKCEIDITSYSQNTALYILSSNYFGAGLDEGEYYSREECIYDTDLPSYRNIFESVNECKSLVGLYFQTTKSTVNSDKYKDANTALYEKYNEACRTHDWEWYRSAEEKFYLTYSDLNGYYFDLTWNESQEKAQAKYTVDLKEGTYLFGICQKPFDGGKGGYTEEEAKNLGKYLGKNKATVKITYPSSSNSVTTAPTAPTTLKATAKSATSAGLTWKSTGADSYNIYRSTSKTGTYKKIGTSTKASYTDKGLTKGKTYYYKVTAVSGDKESEFSKAVSVKAAAPAPSTVKAVKAKSGAAKITWKKTSGASGYEIYMSTSANSGFKKIKTASAKSAASFTKTGLKSGQTYYFKIRTYTGVNGKKVYSGFSKVVKVIV